MPSPTALARRLSSTQSGLLRHAAWKTRDGANRSDGGWVYGTYHSRTKRSLIRLGLVIPNPDKSRSESLLRSVVVGHERIRVREDGSISSEDYAPIYGDRYVSVYFDPKTGEEVEPGRSDREEVILTELGREVLDLLSAD